MELAIALIGLAGVLLGPVVAERFKQRGLRESIKGDLEIHEKLRDCEAKTELRESIERRAAQLAKGKRPLPEPISNVLSTAISLGIVVAVISINGADRWVRDGDGVLRFHFSEGGAISFTGFLIMSALTVIGVPVLYVIADKLRTAISNRRGGTPPNSPAAQKD